MKTRKQKELLIPLRKMVAEIINGTVVESLLEDRDFARLSESMGIAIVDVSELSKPYFSMWRKGKSKTPTIGVLFESLSANSHEPSVPLEEFVRDSVQVYASCGEGWGVDLIEDFEKLISLLQAEVDAMKEQIASEEEEE